MNRRATIFLATTLVAGTGLTSDLIAQRSRRTTPRGGVSRDDLRKAVPTPNPLKPIFDVNWITLSPAGSTPTAWKPTPNPVPGGFSCDYVYPAGSTQWVSATIWNDGGPASGKIHVAPLLLRIDVAGPPKLAAVPQEVVAPPPGGHGNLKLSYRVPNQVGKYQMRIFIAESQSQKEDGFEEHFRDEWYRSSYCWPEFHVVKPKAPVLEIAGATVDRLPPSILARLRLKNIGDGRSEPVSVKIVRWGTIGGDCSDALVVKAPAIMPGGEHEVAATFPICSVKDKVRFEVLGYPDLKWPQD